MAADTLGVGDEQITMGDPSEPLDETLRRGTAGAITAASSSVGEAGAAPSSMMPATAAAAAAAVVVVVAVVVVAVVAPPVVVDVGCSDGKLVCPAA